MTTPQIEDASVALTVTSPPFLDIVDYEADNWLRCWFLGTDPGTVRIARHRSVADWQAFVARTLAELARVTRPGGHVAFEVGEVRNGTVRLEQAVVAATRGLPLETLGGDGQRPGFHQDLELLGRVEQRARHQQQPDRAVEAALMTGIDEG